MADIIQLLPDHIANQIAAGEVIQRPASVVKELMENAIDAGSTEIKLVIKEAGKVLVQVIDNGHGMSDTDLRMSFARHATSKIRKAEDLFSINTMGFRGEALASIAAVAQVEVRSKRAEDELGTKIVIEGSEIKTQEPCQCANGTTFSVKNLFFNIPARRKFLKSNSVEMNNILSEFQHIVLAHPEIFFSLHHNNSEMYHLPAAKIRQRIVGVFGKSYNPRLVPVSEATDIIKISGFVGKPEFAKKKRKGEQFFFVNNRFIRSGYLHHAVMNAYDELIPKGNHPFYAIFLEIDPSNIDINVHPTKQEIKFDDERLVYDYLRVGVRHALGQYNISPTLDFEQEQFFSQAARPTNRIQREDVTHDVTSKSSGGLPSFAKEKTAMQRDNLTNWQKLYEGVDGMDTSGEETVENEEPTALTIGSEWEDGAALDDAEGSFSKQQKKPYQVHNTYIVSQIKSGFLLIDQQSAHERVLFEQYSDAFHQGKRSKQQLLFPKTIEIPLIDAELLRNMLPQINYLGFDIQEFGKESFIIHAIPAELKSGQEEEIIEGLLEQYKLNADLDFDIFQNLARSLAFSSSIKRGQSLTELEMQKLIDELFACEMPFQSPTGRNCFITMELEDLAKRFSNR